jgi:hypothetical protein
MIHAPLMRRVAISGIRMKINHARHDANDGDSQAVSLVRVRVGSARGNFLSLTGADATTLASVRHPLEKGDGVLDETVEFVCAPNDASALLASLEYVNVDMGMLRVEGVSSYENETAAVSQNTNETEADGLRKDLYPDRDVDFVLVEVFADVESTAPSASLNVSVELRVRSPFPEIDGRSNSPSGFYESSLTRTSRRGSLRSTPVILAIGASFAFVVAAARVSLRACFPWLTRTTGSQRERKKLSEMLVARVRARAKRRAEARNALTTRNRA